MSLLSHTSPHSNFSIAYVSSSKWKLKLFAIGVTMLRPRKYFMILRCCFAEDGKQMYKVLKRTCWAIVLPVRSFFLSRPLAVAVVFCWNLFRTVSRAFLRSDEDFRRVEERVTAEGLGLIIKQNIDNFLGARIGKKVQGPHRPPLGTFNKPRPRRRRGRG